jgi:hypothetical protein
MEIAFKRLRVGTTQLAEDFIALHDCMIEMVLGNITTHFGTKNGNT